MKKQMVLNFRDLALIMTICISTCAAQHTKSELDDKKTNRVSTNNVSLSTKRKVLNEGIIRGQNKEKELINIIQSGLKRRNKAPAKVVIVGGGIAGLCAARELMRAGYEIKILESSNRAGGRIFTVRSPFADGLWGEAGAMRIPPIHYLVHAYSFVLNVTMDPFQNTTGKAIYYFDDPDIPIKHIHQDNPKEMKMMYDYWTHKLNIRPESLPITEKFNKTIDDIRKEIEEKGYNSIVSQYDKMSFRNFLKHHNWTDGEILLYSMMSAQESYMETGAIENIAEFVGKVWDDQSEYTHPFTGETIKGLKEVRGGMDKLVKAFLTEDIAGKKISDVIHYGAKVTQLNLQPDGQSKVEVFYETSLGEKSEVCDYVILAVPLTVLRHIRTTPHNWSIEKQKAIRETCYASSGKIFLQYSRQWWLEDPYNFPRMGGVGALTSLPVRQVYFPSATHSDYANTKRGIIIASYTWEQDARIWSSLREENIIKEAVRQVELIFPGTKQFFEVGFVWNWHLDQNTGGGAFSYFLPGQWEELYEAVKKPDGIINDPRFFFAGEHASPIHTWIHGALYSALKTAQELNDIHNKKIL